jgi:hypothetical protein
MNGPFTILASGVALAVGFSLSWTAQDAIAPSPLVPGIRINEIILRADGSAIYDRAVSIDGAFYVWSGQVFNPDGTPHCRGGSAWRYKVSPVSRTERTVDWMVGDDCAGLTADMEFLFTYTSVNGDLADVRYPQTGLGQVAEAIPEEG